MTYTLMVPAMYNLCLLQLSEPAEGAHEVLLCACKVEVAHNEARVLLRADGGGGHGLCLDACSNRAAVQLVLVQLHDNAPHKLCGGVRGVCEEHVGCAAALHLNVFDLAKLAHLLEQLLLGGLRREVLQHDGAPVFLELRPLLVTHALVMA